jgi:hypothetical protein
MPLSSGLSPAVSDLGLGDMLGQQVAGETDEERKKRMALMQQNRLLGPAASPAVASLFGVNAGRGSAGY